MPCYVPLGAIVSTGYRVYSTGVMGVPSAFWFTEIYSLITFVDSRPVGTGPTENLRPSRQMGAGSRSRFFQSSASRSGRVYRSLPGSCSDYARRAGLRDHL